MKLYNTPSGWLATDAAGAAALPDFNFDQWLAAPDPVADLKRRYERATKRPAVDPETVSLPLASQEIWAAGVTYLRSKTARMEESDFAASAYDKVYAAPRPEIFFKATPRRCSASGEPLTLRDDSKWMVPEPELTLVVSSAGKVVGFTIGNDMSCRDIEGDNTLYLPQAKIWDKCCAIGPAVLVDDGSFDIRQSTITLTIRRGGEFAFSGSTEISRIKRSFDELIGYLFRNQSFPAGVLLLTGTGIVPPDEFTLKSGDAVEINIPEIGTLKNAIA